MISNPSVTRNWGLDSMDSKGGAAQAEVEDSKLGFVGDGIDFWTIWAPHWFLALLFAIFAAVPWIPWSRQFSLRTMLIVTAVISALLGLMVWLSTYDE